MEDRLIAKIETLPTELQDEVKDFVDFLLHKTEIQNNPVFGSAPGFYKMTDDFDAELEDFSDYMPTL